MGGWYLTFYERIENAANLATILATALLSIVVVKTHFLASPTPLSEVPRPTVATVGTNLKGRLGGVNSNENERTLVLTLSTQCHFCRESTPFYRRLNQQLGNAVRIVAVLSQPVEEGEQYLKKPEKRGHRA